MKCEIIKGKATVFQCIDNKWIEKGTCALGCDLEGKNCKKECEVGKTKCENGKLYDCSSGFWRETGKECKEAQCTPKTCSDLGKECGKNWDDGCGGKIDCGVGIGEKECEGNALKTCGNDGKFTSVSCPEGCDEIKRECKREETRKLCSIKITVVDADGNSKRVELVYKKVDGGLFDWGKAGEGYPPPRYSKYTFKNLKPGDYKIEGKFCDYDYFEKGCYYGETIVACNAGEKTAVTLVVEQGNYWA